MLGSIGALLKKPFWKIVWEVRGTKEDINASRGGADLKVEDLDNAVKYVIDVMRLDPTRDVVMDIGCGIGYMAERLVPHARAVTGVDLSSTLVARARATLSRYPNADVVQAEAARIPKPDQSYSKIVCYAVVHSFPSRDYLRRFLVEVRRLLTDDGVALIADVSERGKWDFDIVGRFGPIKRAYYMAQTVVIDLLVQTRFSRDDFVRMARDAGLEATILRQPEYLPFHASRFDVLLRRMPGSHSVS